MREVRDFFQAHPLEDTDQSIVQSLEAFSNVLAFNRRARGQVRRWLEAR